MSNEKKAVIIRHRFSGVWIAYLIGPGMFENTINIEGRRIWSWSGGRLECSQLAHQGVTAADKLGDWINTDIAIAPGDGLVEIAIIDGNLVEKARSLPRCNI